MAVSSIGWRGSIGESEIAELLALAGVRTSVRSEADWKPTAVAGNRQVAIAAGVGYAAFIRSFSDSAAVLSFDAPLAGQWYLVVNRRTWAGRTSEFMALEGSTTSSVVPGRPPLVFPADYANEPGVVFDQEICWAWVNGATTTVRIWDVREPPLSVRVPPAHGFMSDGPHNAVYTLPDFIINSGAVTSPPNTPAIQANASPRAADLFTPLPGGIVRLRKPGIYSATARCVLEYPATNRSFAMITIAGLQYRAGVVVGEDQACVTIAGIPTFEADVDLSIRYYIIFAASQRIIREQRISLTYHGPNGS